MMTEPKRKLRTSFVKMCGGNVTAALMLDFLICMHGMDGESAQLLPPREPWGDYHALMTSTPERTLVFRPTRTQAMGAIRVLVQRHYVEAHPSNASYGGTYCLNAAKVYDDWFSIVAKGQSHD